MDADDGESEAFERLGSAACGAIALITSKEMKNLDDLFAEYMKSGDIEVALGRAYARRIEVG